MHADDAKPSAGRPSRARQRGGEAAPVSDPLTDFDAGFVVGLLVGEGHFGGDGRQPQVALRMHTDHAAVFGWLMARFPDSRLYGPYEHAGRRYYQWMARGAFLRQRLLPILEANLRADHSARVWDRYLEMRRRYGLGEPGERAPDHDRMDDAAGPPGGLGYTRRQPTGRASGREPSGASRARGQS